MTRAAWYTIAASDIAGEIKYEMENHSWTKSGSFPWEYCRYCGLIALRNKFTKWAINKGCNNSYHPGYHEQWEM